MGHLEPLKACSSADKLPWPSGLAGGAGSIVKPGFDHGYVKEVTWEPPLFQNGHDGGADSISSGHPLRKGAFGLGLKISNPLLHLGLEVWGDGFNEGAIELTLWDGKLRQVRGKPLLQVAGVLIIPIGGVIQGAPLGRSRGRSYPIVGCGEVCILLGKLKGVLATSEHP